MKSNATMHELAMAMAMTYGPRAVDLGKKTYVGLMLSPDELKALFAREGYVTESGRHLKQIARWADRGDTMLVAGYAVFVLDGVPVKLQAENVAKEQLADGKNVEILGNW